MTPEEVFTPSHEIVQRRQGNNPSMDGWISLGSILHTRDTKDSLMERRRKKGIWNIVRFSSYLLRTLTNVLLCDVIQSGKKNQIQFTIYLQDNKQRDD